jgi:hypothetical protein
MLRIRSIFEVQFWDIQAKVIKNGSHSNSVIEISVWELGMSINDVPRFLAFFDLPT